VKIAQRAVKAHEKRHQSRIGDAGAPHDTRSEKRRQLLVMIAALWIVKNSGADNDCSTHGDERNYARQYPDHDRLPWFLLSTL
jgi:hypothetical protein